MIPRGIRNHNPLNIRRTAKDQWKGLAERQQDAAFCQFKSLEYGWRAAFYLLTRTYYHKYRLYTIRSIIRRWAPSNENNSEAGRWLLYILFPLLSSCVPSVASQQSWSGRG